MTAASALGCACAADAITVENGTTTFATDVVVQGTLTAPPVPSSLVFGDVNSFVAASGGAEGNATNSAELRISRIASVMEVSTVVGTIDVNVAAPSTWQVYDIAIETTNGTPTNVKMVMKRTANGYAVSGVGNVAVGSVVVFSIPVNDTFTVFARTNRDNVLMKARATSTDVYLTCRAVTSEYYGIHQTAINFTQLRKEYVKKN